MPEKLSLDAQRIIGLVGGTIVRGAMKPAYVVAEGVAHALQLAGDDARLTTATVDQLVATQPHSEREPLHVRDRPVQRLRIAAFAGRNRIHSPAH